jgi:hypothetical protein
MKIKNKNVEVNLNIEALQLIGNGAISPVLMVST